MCVEGSVHVCGCMHVHTVCGIKRYHLRTQVRIRIVVLRN